MIRTYKYKLRPNKRFVAEAERWLRFFCLFYNAALEERIGAYKTGVRICVYDQQKQLTEIRSEDPEVKSFNRDATVDVLWRLEYAMKEFLRRLKTKRCKAGFPRFKSAKNYSSLCFPKGNFKVEGDKVILSKLGSCRIRLHRPLVGLPKTAIITRRIDGWYVAFQCDVPVLDPLPLTGEAVGVDLGLKNFVTLSNGESITNPRFYCTVEGKVQKAHRRFSKTNPSSKNHIKAKRCLAALQLKILRQRLNFAHLVANQIIKRFDRIVVEKLNVSRMVKERSFSKNIQDAGWSTFVDILTYKAENAGRELVKVDPRGTSQDCSSCGARQKMELSQRRFTCDCGLDLHRDHNAAINILARAEPVTRVLTAQ